MTPEHWARVKEVFAVALDKPEVERAAYLDEACGSEGWLRDEVERLLAAHDSRSMESPVAAQPELTPGQMLRHYRVEAKLGQGGMGTVYKAHDTQLQRPVALKILSGPHRFLREARAASALNHPGIVTVYEAGSENGTDFIAMEFVDGQSLDKLIPSRGMPLARALEIAAAAAGALAKAHAAGIIHRDLKPANIMVTRDGQVKLLDFGLARRVDLPGAAASTFTTQGEIVGTPAYMSPEQAEGRTADGRSDIFSFGAVLYEMLSGRRAFTGDSTISVLGAVLKENPPALAGLPSELATLVERCLRKDPARRMQHMGDVQLVLDDLKNAKPETESTPALHGRRRRMIVWTGIAMAVLTVAGLTLWNSSTSVRGEMRVVPLTNYPGSESFPSFSPDGSQVAFTWDREDQGNSDIYVKVVGSAAEPLRLTSDPAPDLGPVWSPDGRNLAFLRQQPGVHFEIYLVSPLGGPERKLTELQFTPMGLNISAAGSWSPDGKWLALSERPAQGPWGISLFSLDRRERRWVTSNSTGVDFAPAFSLDGQHLAYASCQDRSAVACDIYVLHLDPSLQPRGQPRRLTRQGFRIDAVAWSPDNQSVLYSAGRCLFGSSPLWRVASSGGEPPARVELPGPDVGYLAVSRAANRLVYVQGRGDLDIWKYETGNQTRSFIASTARDYSPQFSPDGNRIAYTSARSTGCAEIWVSNQDGSGSIQLTNEIGRLQGSPYWSPDGRWIAFDSLGDDGRAHVYLVDAAGGPPRLLTPSSFNESVPSWSRDGRWIYFRSDRSGRNEIWKLPFEGGEARQVTVNGGYTALESWDGTTLYYQKTVVSEPLFAMHLPAGPERQILERVRSRAFYPAREGIYYIEREGAARSSSLLKLYDVTSGKSRILTQIERRTEPGLTVSPDGRRALFSVQSPPAADLVLIENFR